MSTLAAGRALWGNAPAVLRRVRDPMLVTQALGRRGFAVPAVHFRRTRNPEPGTRNLEPGTVKPLASGVVNRWRSGGGRRVRPWRRGARVPRGCYLQELVDGTPGSVVFVAAGGRAVPLGITRQLIGEHAFGAAGYRYCGNILEAADDPQFGMNGARGPGVRDRPRGRGVRPRRRQRHRLRRPRRRPHAIEVNPRWSASMELVERAYGLSVFGAHAAACAEGALPEFDLAGARCGSGAAGKAVVFARRDVVVGDTRAWLAHPASPALPALPADEFAGIRDVPHPGETIAAGRPVCTVFATGRDAASCHAALVRRAERVYAELARWEREVA